MNGNNSIIEQLKKENGATSIFVIILMVVLIVFGLAALTTSLASLKLSNKNTIWVKEYYLLEGEAESYLAMIDSTLKTAAKEAVVESNGNLNEYINLYYNKTWSMLDELSRYTSEIKVFRDSNRVTFTVREDKEAFPKNISVVLQIIEPSTEDNQYYKILQWKEWQNQFEYDQDINFEDPNFENPNFEELELENPDFDDSQIQDMDVMQSDAIGYNAADSETNETDLTESDISESDNDPIFINIEEQEPNPNNYEESFMEEEVFID